MSNRELNPFLADDAVPDRFGAETQRIAAHCPVAVIESVAEAVRYRKAWSDLQLLDALGTERPKNGIEFHVLTGGEIDQISWIHVVLRYVRTLDRLVLSSWNVSADGCRDIRTMLADGRINTFVLFIGEFASSSRANRAAALAEIAAAFPTRFRYYRFPVHAKIIAGISVADDFAFAVETSADCNINKRIEQACFAVSARAYSFFNDYFSAIEKRIADGIPAARDLRGKRAQAAFDL